MTTAGRLAETAALLSARLGVPIFAGAAWETAAGGREVQLDQLAQTASTALAQLASEEPGRELMRARLSALWFSLGADSVMHLAPDGLLTVVGSTDPAHPFTQAQLRDGIETLLRQAAGPA